MSADVWIVLKQCECCGRSGDGAELNITYNLSKMLAEAGFMGWREIVGKPAREVGAHIIGVLDGMTVDPERWRAMNPPNGWGDYDQSLQDRMRRWALECIDSPPDALIGGWL